MKVIGGGQVIGDYVDIELESDEDIGDLRLPMLKEGRYEWFSVDQRFRLVRWITDRFPAPMVAAKTVGTDHGNATERFRDSKPYSVLWSRDGLAEIRFDEDGCVYIVECEGKGAGDAT